MAPEPEGSSSEKTNDKLASNSNSNSNQDDHDCKSQIATKSKNKTKGKTRNLQGPPGKDSKDETVTKDSDDRSSQEKQMSKEPEVIRDERAVPDIDQSANECETEAEQADILQISSGDQLNNDQANNDVDQKDSLNDDDGDPIPSGTGTVSRDCSASDLIGWSEVLPKWHSKLSQRPKGLDALVRCGIPEPLRGEVWQLLSGAQQSPELMDRYRILLTMSAATEQIILRDVHRTYPAHENFRSNSGSSSLLDSLFKVCKAYAVYDEEVGYCQGLSFLVAALLLHMPEEQAFCVFVRIMQHYGLRDLFRNNFDELYLKFYQLERLLEDNMPDLYQHFSLIGIEPFTYASQWFLTVFTAKFPLNAVFYILDIFLLDGMNTIFQIALALLQSSRQELLSLDFEGVLKYFRVQMPKLYRNQENVQKLIAASSTISLKKLSRHAKSYEVMKQKERLLENPISRLERENAKLTENNLRLEQENDDLARDLVASKIQLRSQLDMIEDKAETLNRALIYSRQDCQSYLNTISDMEDERSRLEVEVSQLKEVCRRELTRAETSLARDASIIADYKTICSQLSKRLDHRLDCAKSFVASLSELLRDDTSCTDRKCYATFQAEAQQFLDKILTENKIDLNDSSPSTSITNDDSPKSQQSAKRHDNLREHKTTSELDYANRPVGALVKSTLLDSKSTSSEAKIKQLTDHIDELEVELARTKLALVEAECKCQQLKHDLSAGLAVDASDTVCVDGAVKPPSGGGGLSKKLDFMRVAVSSSGAKKSYKSQVLSQQTLPSTNVTTNVSGAFSKLNNLISNISQNYPSAYASNRLSSIDGPTSSSLPVSTSTPALSKSANGAIGQEASQSGQEASKMVDVTNVKQRTVRCSAIPGHHDQNHNN